MPWLFVLLLTACGDDAPVERADASVDADVDAAPVEPIDPAAPPTPPEAPRFAACPEGWVSASDDIAHCEPAIATCDDPDAALPDGACSEALRACPAGDFAEGLPDDRAIVFVRPGATGTGTREAPFGDLAEAIGAAPTGALIALAKGRYEGAWRAGNGLELRGACARETILTSPARALLIDGANVTIGDLAIDSTGGDGIDVVGATDVAIERVVIERATGAGIALEAASVSLREVIVRDSRAMSSGSYGWGLSVANGSALTADHLVVIHCRETGVYADDAGTTVAITRSAIRDIDVNGDGIGGMAVNVTNRAVARLESSVIAGVHTFGVYALAAGRAELEDVVVRNVLRTRPGYRTVALASWDVGSVIAGTRVLVEDVQGAGISVQGGHAELTDALVRRLEGSEAAGDAGRGADVAERGSLRLERAAVIDAEDIAIGVFEAGATAELLDVAIRDTRPYSNGTHGRGIEASSGSELSAVRVELSRNHDVALLISAARGHLEDLLVADTMAAPADAFGRGRAISAQDGADVEIVRARLSRMREIALYVAGATLTADDLVVEDTAIADCDEATCGERSAGIGVGSYNGAAVRLERFTVRNSPLCGLQVELGELDLATGLVAGNGIGICVQSDHELDRLERDVLYSGNGQTLAATRLPVPEPLEN